jgi:hypothetical protein
MEGTNVRKSHLEVKKWRKLRNLKNRKLRKFEKLRNLHCISFFFCTESHFLALYFEKIALLLANQNWKIFSCILLIFWFVYLFTYLFLYLLICTIYNISCHVVTVVSDIQTRGEDDPSYIWVHWRSNFKNKCCLSRENQS